MAKSDNPALKDIEKHTREYADKRDTLTQRIQVLKDAQEALRREHIAGIIRATRSAKEAYVALRMRIAEHPGTFTKPRTHIFSGVRVGYMKGKGKLNMPKNIVELINKKLPDQADVLINTTYKPVASALQNLDACDLKKLGITITDSGDEIVIKNTDSDIEKMVGAILQLDEVNDDTVI